MKFLDNHGQDGIALEVCPFLTWMQRAQYLT